MPIETQTLNSSLSLATGAEAIWLLFSISLIILAVLHFIFTLFVVRQVGLMTDTVKTEAAPLLRALSILYAGLGLGIVVLFIGLLL